MTEPLKFTDKLPTLAGGREAIMMHARALWEEKPPGATMNAKARAKYAVAVILEAIQDNVRKPLTDLIDAHVQIVEDEYVLFEGEAPPDDTSAEGTEWWLGLYAAQDRSLSGDVERMVGLAALMKWVRGNDDTGSLVELILAKPIEDTARALSACGITPEDVTALAATGPAPAPVADEGVAPTEAAAPTRTRRRSPSISGPTPVTEAAKVLLETLAEHVKDADVAEALEVSRSQVVNYRRGTTLFAPDALQIKKLETLVKTAVARLEGAFGALRSAVEIAELE